MPYLACLHFHQVAISDTLQRKIVKLLGIQFIWMKQKIPDRTFQSMNYISITYHNRLMLLGKLYSNNHANHKYPVWFQS
jgi:hypothetical protein